MVRSCCGSRAVQQRVPHRQLPYQSVRMAARRIGREVLRLGRRPSVPELRERRPVPAAAALPGLRRGEIHPQQPGQSRPQRPAAGPDPSIRTTGAGSRPRGAPNRRAVQSYGAYRARSPRSSGPSTCSCSRSTQVKKDSWVARSSRCSTGASPRAAARWAVKVLFPDPAWPSTATSRTGPQDGARARSRAGRSERSFMSTSLRAAPEQPQVTSVDQTNIGSSARAESLAGSGHDPR